MSTACGGAWIALLAGAAFAQAQVPVTPAPLPQAPVPVTGGPGTPAPSTQPAAPPPATAPAPELLPLPAPVPGPAVSGNAAPANPAVVPPAPPGDYLVPDVGPRRVWPVAFDGEPRFWISGDFLLWFVKNGPLNVPLVTTGSTADANAGALGQPHTRVLFGDNTLDYGAIPGGRLEAGYWFGDASRWGVEAGFFLLAQKTTDFSALSDNSGNPVLAVPIFNAQKRAEDQVTVAFPGVYAGGVFVHSESTMGGANVDGCFNLVRDHGLQVDLLGGFRYVNLQEELDVQTPDVNISSSSQSAGTAYNTVDYFRTNNDFYGGEIGARVGWCRDRLSADLLACVAVGSTNQWVYINGYGSAATPGGTPSYPPGGIFAQPTNSGRYRSWDFSVVPELSLKLGYRVWHNVQLTVGYDFLYWSSVVRPGDQINREVNLSQSGLLGGGTLSGPAQPVAPLGRTDFFVNGLNLGMEVRW